MSGRKRTYRVALNNDERKKLKSIIRKKDTPLTICRRCRILLILDENQGKSPTHEQCAAQMGVSRGLVTTVAKSYATEGIDATITRKRNANSDNARRKMDGRAEARLMAIACGPAPEGHARWTMRLLAERMQVVLEMPVSKDTICRTLKKTNFART